jgi:hypothetical protein
MSLRQFPLVALLTLLLGGCATGSGVALTGDTLMLGEVRHVLTRELYESGRIFSNDEPRDLSKPMARNGFADAQPDAGRLLLVRVLVYWNNTASDLHLNRPIEWVGLQVPECKRSAIKIAGNLRVDAAGA